MNRTKRILALLLTCLLLLTSVQFAAADGGSDYFPEEFTESGCDGETPTGRATEHLWQRTSFRDPTCTADGTATYTCYFCGRTKTKSVGALGHDWCDWDPFGEPTCTEPARAVRYCMRCQLEEFGEIPALGHQYGERKVTKNPTCTQSGAWERVCEVCGYVRRGTIEPLGHEWGEWRTVSRASSRIPGLEERTCARCGETEQRETVLAAKQEYALELFLSPAPTDADELLYADLAQSPDAGDPVDYKATVCNVGTKPVTLKEFHLYPGDKLQQLPFPKKLGVGESVTFTVPVVHAAVLMDKSEAEGRMLGTLTYDWTFYGEADGKRVCESNTVTYRYRVMDEPTGYTPWTAPAATTSESVLVELDGYMGDYGDSAFYTILVQNLGDVDLPEVALWDTMIRSDEPIYIIPLAAGQARILRKSYTVTNADLARGCIVNRVYAEWTDPDSGEAVRALSEPLTIPTARPTAEEAGLAVQLHQESAPANELFFTEGETIPTYVTLRNRDVCEYENAVVHVTIGSAEATLTIDRIPPSSDAYWDNLVELREPAYTVTAADRKLGYVYGYVYVTADRVNEDGTRTQKEYSDWYRYDCGAKHGNEYATLSKIDLSTPNNGKFYVEGESVRYRITAKNISDKSLYVCFYDTLYDKDLFDYIDSFHGIKPGEEAQVEYSHTVTKEEAEAGEIVSWGFVELSPPEEDNAVYDYTNEVVSPTGKEYRTVHPIRWPNDKPFPRLPGSRGCRRNAAGDAHCDDHNRIVDAVEALKKEAAGNPEQLLDVLKSAQQLWSDEADTLYRSAAVTADAVQKSALLGDRLTWNNYMKARGSLLRAVRADNPEAAEQQLADDWEDFSSDLCLLLHEPDALAEGEAGDPGMLVTAEEPESKAEGEANDPGVLVTAEEPEAKAEGEPNDPGVLVTAEESETRTEGEPGDVGEPAVSIDEPETLAPGEEPDTFKETREKANRAVERANAANAPAYGWREAQTIWQLALDQLLAEKYAEAGESFKKLLVADRIAFDRYLNAHRDLLASIFGDRPEMVEELIARLIEDKTIETDRLLRQ